MAIFEDGSYSCTPGIALIAKVLAGRCQMEYTRAAVGKGQIPEGQSPKTMTEPADFVMNAKISAVTNPVNGECQITVQINSSDVAQGFYATGILLYAADPDEGEVPYTYLVLENGPEWIRPSSSAVGKLATFDLIAAVGDVDKVTATIDPDSIVTRAVVEQLIAGATVKRKLTIPATGWDVGAEEGAEGSFYVDIPQSDVTEEMVPVISVVPADMETATECGLCTAARTMDGKIRLYAEKAPTAEIQACLLLLNASNGVAGGGGTTGGGGSYTLPAATATQLGGVKIGENVSVTPDGTISVDGDELLDDVAASDEDVQEMLDDTFNSSNEGEGN